MGYPLPLVMPIILGNDGLPLAYGTVETYIPGTSTPLATYEDADLTVLNANPTTLDGYGRKSIYVADGVPYKIIVKDVNGVLVFTEPEVMVPAAYVDPGGGPSPTPDPVPPGTFAPFGGAAAPTGWLLCDGSPVSRTTFADLFAAIGTSYGPGNGTTTFNLPDARGRFILGKAASGTGSALGNTGGSLDHVHTGPSHTHTIADHTHNVPGHSHSIPHNGWSTALAIPPNAGVLQAGGSGSGSESAVTMATAPNVSGNSTALVTTAASLSTAAAGTGNTGAANPPYLVANWVIKT